MILSCSGPTQPQIAAARRFLGLLVLGPLVIPTWSCSGEDGPFSTSQFRGRGAGCTIAGARLHDTGVPRDGIPALSDPDMVPADDPAADYVLDNQRVIGLEVGGTYLAIPHNILWWHEIVNLNSLQTPLAITYCPLTGSSMVFDRSSVRGVEFGVSGLLFSNNLVMYDRVPGEDDRSFWPQMMAGAQCGPQSGKPLEFYPATEMRWDAWRRLHPTTLVVSPRTGYARDYRSYPYGGYESVDNPQTLFPHETFDPRRAPKERVLGIRKESGGGVAFPFMALDSEGPRRVVHYEIDGEPIVVFWDRISQAAVAFRSGSSQGALSFQVHENGFRDVETGSRWSLEGVSTGGMMEGERLVPIPNAFVSFWFAWATFVEDTDLWLPWGVTSAPGGQPLFKPHSLLASQPPPEAS